MKTLMEQVENLDARAEEQLSLVEKPERLEWLNHPVTQALILRLATEELDGAAHWAEGDYTAETADQTAQLNARELGKCQALGEVRQWLESLSADDEEPEETPDDE